MTVGNQACERVQLVRLPVPMCITSLVGNTALRRTPVGRTAHSKQQAPGRMPPRDAVPHSTCVAAAARCGHFLALAASLPENHSDGLPPSNTVRRRPPPVSATSVGPLRADGRRVLPPDFRVSPGRRSERGECSGVRKVRDGLGQAIPPSCARAACGDGVGPVPGGGVAAGTGSPGGRGVQEGGGVELRQTRISAGARSARSSVSAPSPPCRPDPDGRPGQASGTPTAPAAAHHDSNGARRSHRAGAAHRCGAAEPDEEGRGRRAP